MAFKLFLLPVFSAFIVCLSGIVLPEIVYRYTKGTKLEKILDHYIVRIIGAMLTVYVDTMLILLFIHFIC